MPRPVLQGDPTQLRKVFNRSLAAKAAVAAGLDPAKRHLRLVVHGRAVDMANARLHPLRQGQRTPGVATEDRRRQAELRVVGQTQQGFVSITAQQHRHRPERLFAVQTHVFGDAIDQGRLQDTAFQLAAHHQPCTFGEGIVDQGLDARAGTRIKALIDDALAKGARLVVGGQLEGSILQPTLIDGVTEHMRLYREESFGPVAVLLRGDGDEALLRLANDSEFGLSAAIFSRDTGRALALAQRVESGICHINGPTVHDEAQMPFGGVKSSGYGSFGGKASIEHFTQLRWVTLQNGPRHYPI